MIRKLDDVGRLVIPAEYRKALGITSKAEMHMDLRDGVIVVKPVHAEGPCPVCGRPRDAA